MADELRERTRGFQKFSIADRIKPPTENVELASGTDALASNDETALHGDSDWLPKAADLYAAHSRPGNKPEISLNIMMKDGSWEGFAYGDLGRIQLLPANKPGGGMRLVMRFIAAPVTHVSLEGTELKSLLVLLSRHRVFWIREHPGGAVYRNKVETVINRITIVESKD